jgi:hypothetical protein
LIATIEFNITSQPGLGFNNAMGALDWITGGTGATTVPSTTYISYDIIGGTVQIDAPADTTPPTYSSISTNTTIAGASCSFNCLWQDDVNVSGYIFGTNNTGSWVNDTWTTAWASWATSRSAWADAIKTLNSTVGLVVGYEWWVNDTSNNWNSTSIQTLTTVATPPLATIYVNPASIINASMTPSSNFQINVSIQNAVNLASFSFVLSFNSSIVQATSAVWSWNGHSLGLQVSNGIINGSTNISPPITGSASLVTGNFNVTGLGSSILHIAILTLLDSNGNQVPSSTQDGYFSNMPPLSASISPYSTSIQLGQNVNFTSTVSGGVPPYSYQWYSNGTIVSGANSNSWDFTPTATGSDSVYLNVTDNVGNTTDSNNAYVTVTQPPPLAASISSSSTTMYVGQTENLSSTVGGGVPPYSYQWLLNGSLILNATLANYTFSPTSSGLYLFSMSVTDYYGNTSQSNTVSITVMPPLTGPEIYVDPPQILNLSLGPGSLFSINITVANVTNLGGCMFNITYDPNVLTWTGLNFVETQGEYPWVVLNGSSIAGYAWISLSYLYPITVQSAPLIVMNFAVNSYGITPLNLTNTVLLDQYGNPIVHNTFNGIFANIIRDVAVTNVVPAASWVYQNWTDTINVTLSNLGNVTESFTASAWYNNSLIGSAAVVNLAPNAQTIVSIVWDTTGVPDGNYTITGTASLVPYENYFNTTNNVYVDGLVQVFVAIQDVAITSVQPTIPWAYVGQVVPVNVTAANLGNVSETFTVTTYYNGTAISTITVVDLENGTSQVLTIYWNTSGISVEGNYTLSAFASYVPFEYNTTNNYLIGGQEAVLTQIRDVAITDVQLYPQMMSPIYNVTMVEVYTNRIVAVNVTAGNVGNVSETFTVSAYVDGNISLGAQIITLTPQTSTIVTFYWSPTGQTPSSTVLHTVSANASFVQYEYNTTNNFMNSSVQIMIKMFGDINGDGRVDLLDLSLLAASWLSTRGNYNYNPEADFYNDGTVFLDDLTLLAENYLKSY